RARRTQSRGGRIAAAALLFVALTLRHNALPAVVPIAVFIAMASKRGPRRVWLGRGAALVVLLALAAALLDRAVDERRSVFPATALWDLAAISIQTNTILLPPGTYGPALTVDDLAQAFDEFSNTSLFARTRAGLRQPFFAADDPLNAAVHAAWLDAILAHPGAYLRHRWRLTRALFGTRPRTWPHELVYVDGEIQYADNSPVAPNDGAIHGALVRGFENARDGWWFAAWPYLVLAIGAFAATWRRTCADPVPARVVLLSGLLYAAPLPVVAPSAELRYLGWTCVAAILGAVLAFAAPRRSALTSSAYPPAP
ncbi:MAG TPA: hypothetical protein VF132_05890, partial [Rudaea sp.]